MKKLICMVLILVMLTGSACATIIGPRGVDLEFKMTTGIEAKRAVVLCKSLSANVQPNASARKIRTLSAGYTFLTWESQNEWRNCYLSADQEPAWVRDYYVIIDPAYYQTDELTPVYAYGDLNAPRIGLLDNGEEYPIIMETTDWCVISLRGASGWVRKTSRDTFRRGWFMPESLANVRQAVLSWQGGQSTLTDPNMLMHLSSLLMDSHDMGTAVSGCPFGAYLTLTLASGENVVMELATDGCCIYRIGGHDYRYGSLVHATARQLFELFPGYYR